MAEPGELVLARDTQRGAVHRAHRQGALERLRVGAYQVPEPTTGFDTDRRRAVARVLAVHRQLRAAHVFSHETAALLRGLPLWNLPTRTHLYQAYRASSRAAGDLARHVGVVEPAHRAMTAGVPATTLVRTVVDCALTMHPLESLVVADAALGLGQLDLTEAIGVLEEAGRRNGWRRARWVLDHADGGAQSPWETWARYVCLRAGLPRPRTQAPVATRIGTFHCDLGWEELGVYLEFDGRSKYVDDGVRAGHDARRELFEEKRRGDALAEAGVRPVRIVASDARVRRGEEPVVARIARRFPVGVRRACRTVPFLPPPPPPR